jgi:ligand-binding SRPBCC domain-containing protein
MIRISAAACIEAPTETVWAQLAKLEDVQLWAEAVVHASCEGALSQGVGAERICKLTSNHTIKEYWVAWEEGRGFTYEASGIPLIKRAANQWTVIPHGDQTLLRSEAELEIKGGIFGILLEPIIGPLMRRMAPNALASFKYLVEHGHPYEGKASELPRPPITC